jgi:hypothetical protein
LGLRSTLRCSPSTKSRSKYCPISPKRTSTGSVFPSELRASIDWARQQQAKSWELRSSTTLAQLLVERGERDAARELLTPIYNWFTEGFDTHDLKAAHQLLESLR